MSQPALKWAWKQKTESPYSKFILLTLAFKANAKNEVLISQSDLAKVCRMSRQAISSNIKKLKKLGLVSYSRITRSDGGTGPNRN